VYISTREDALVAVDAPPTAAHPVGDGHEIASSPALVRFGTAGGDWDQAVPLPTSPI
jgi:hypothetical protein